MKPDHKKKILEKLVKCEDIEDPEKHFNLLRTNGDNLAQETDFNNLFKFLSALANKKRLIIMNILKEKDRCVCELEAILDESQPSVSHHLKILETAGLIRGWKKGKFTHYNTVEEKLKECKDLLTQYLT